MEGKLMMSTTEAAGLMGCTRSAVAKMLGRGDLPGAKVGGRWYVNRAELSKRLGLDDVHKVGEDMQ